MSERKRKTADTEEEIQARRKKKYIRQCAVSKVIRISKATFERWVRVKSIVKTAKSSDAIARILLESWEKHNLGISLEESTQIQREVIPDQEVQGQESAEDAGSNRDIVEERKAICGHTELLDLANLRIKRLCSQNFCSKMVSVSTRYVGTSVQLNWICSNNHHVYTWNSQPKINDMPAIDLLLTSILPDTDCLAVKISLSKIGIEMMSPTDKNATRERENYLTYVKKEPDYHNSGSEYLQQYPLVDIENVKTEVTTEEDTPNDMILGEEDIKLEVEDDEETDTASDSSSDEVFNYLNNAKNVKKISGTSDDVTKDCAIRSSRIKEKGYRPNYSALEWNEEVETAEELISEKPKGMKNKKDVKNRKKDPDFQISYSDYDDSDGLIGDVTDDSVNEESDTGAETNASKQSKNTSNKPKCGPKKERMKKSSSQKEKKSEPKKPWIKIHLEDHTDKYQTEKVESFERRNRGIDASENLYSCLVCLHFKCSTKDSIEDHLEKHINKVLECETCHYIGYCKTDMREHGKKCVGGGTTKAVFVCEICGMSAHSCENKRNHMGKVHDIPEWKCRYCPVMSKTKHRRLEHMKQEHSELCQYCTACRKSKHTLSKEDFEHHKKNCASKEQCEICGQLIHKGGMRKHVHDKHENVRKYQCEKCPYSAKSFKRLKTHQYSHDNIHPYSCDLCPFTCVQKYQLVSHMRTHSGDKPYKCTQCKYAAAWNVQLKQHVKVHSMETAITCEKCEVMFKNEKTLNLHLKKGQCML